MEKLAKNKALIILSAILLVANLVILSLWLFGRDHKPSKPQQGNALTNFLKNDVKFDENQFRQFETAKHLHWDSMKPMFSQLSNSKQRFFKLAIADTASKAEVDSLANIIGQNQASIDKAFLGHFRQIRRLCRKDQKPVFDSLFPQVVRKMSGGKSKK